MSINFEESPEAMVAAMLSPGIDLRPALQAGTLRFLTAMPEAMGAEEHLIRALKIIAAFQPDHVVVDAISACKRMGMEMAAYDYLMRLVNACKEQGITVLLINQLSGFQEEHEISGIGISSMVDSVIFLRYIDVGGEINRMLLVMKARGSKHSNQYREFLITDQGIDIVDVYVGAGGGADRGGPAGAGSPSSGRAPTPTVGNQAEGARGHPETPGTGSADCLPGGGTRNRRSRAGSAATGRGDKPARPPDAGEDAGHG
jgi:archaellum biogenesis ATPase FlaH